MARTHTSKILIAIAIGGMSGVAIVWKDDRFTQFVGFLVGAIGLSFVYIALCLFARLFAGKAFFTSTDPLKASADDYEQRAYRIERVFMDDGKPW